MAGKKFLTYCPSAVRPEMPTATRDAVQRNEMTFVSVSCHRLLLDSSHQLLLNFFSSGAINFFSSRASHQLLNFFSSRPSGASPRWKPSVSVSSLSATPSVSRCHPPNRPEMSSIRLTRDAVCPINPSRSFSSPDVLLLEATPYARHCQAPYADVSPDTITFRAAFM